MQYSVFSGGKVLTPNGVVDGGVVVRDGVVTAVVSPREAREIAAHDDVASVDLRRGCLVPGFVDAHFHLMALALKRLRCDLSGLDSASALVERLGAHRGPGAAVVGVDWDESRWTDKTLPTRTDLDAISSSAPVYARRICGHVGVANTALVERLTVAKRFVNTDTGVITEDAVFEANRICYPPADDVADSLEPAVGELHALGVTTIHDIIDTAHFDVYLEGLRRSRAPLRIYGLLHTEPGGFAPLAQRAVDARQDGFHAAGVKVFADGSLGARTAALEAPYADADSRGDLIVAAGKLEDTVRDCVDAGIVCAVHAIGDRAVRAAAEAMAIPGTPRGQLRIEHAEVLSKTLVGRLAELGILLVMQPNFVREWGGEGGLYERRLGTARWRWTNPFRTLESAGVPFVFSSDGMPAGPLYGISGATRHPIVQQRLTPRSALLRYTGAAHELPPYRRSGGHIEPGAVADFVVLSGNPLVADPDRLSVDATYLSGAAVYRRPGLP